MAQVWTIIFVAVVAVAFAVAHWQDCCDARRRDGRRDAAREKRDEGKAETMK